MQTERTSKRVQSQSNAVMIKAVRISSRLSRNSAGYTNYPSMLLMRRKWMLLLQEGESHEQGRSEKKKKVLAP